MMNEILMACVPGYELDVQLGKLPTYVFVDINSSVWI